MGSPVSGRDCVLPQYAIVTKTFHSFWWVWFLAFVWGPPTSGWRWVLRTVIVPKAVPPSSRFGPAPSRWVPLLRARSVWGLQPFASPGVFLRDGVTL